MDTVGDYIEGLYKVEKGSQLYLGIVFSDIVIVDFGSMQVRLMYLYQPYLHTMVLDSLSLCKPRANNAS